MTAAWLIEYKKALLLSLSLHLILLSFFMATYYFSQSLPLSSPTIMSVVAINAAMLPPHRASKAIKKRSHSKVAKRKLIHRTVLSHHTVMPAIVTSHHVRGNNKLSPSLRGHRQRSLSHQVPGHKIINSHHKATKHVWHHHHHRLAGSTRHNRRLSAHHSTVMTKPLSPLRDRAFFEQQLQAEKVQLQQALSSDREDEIRRYKDLILAAIAKHLLVFPNVSNTLNCQLFIQLTANGDVINVNIVKSSGNSAFDRLAQTAVLQSSPLPLPHDRVSSEFRAFYLTVKPQKLLSQQ